MKRVDLIDVMLDRIIKDLSWNIEMKVNDLLDLLGSAAHKPKIILQPFLPVRQLFNYASADQSMMNILRPYEDTGYYPNEQVMQVVHTLFLPPTGVQSSFDVPVDFWDTPLGYVCKVARARGTLDCYMPLTVMELAVLADRKHTTIQQHCQRGSIKAIKDEKAWKIPPTSALNYLKSVRSKPFYNHYDEKQYKASIKKWLQTGFGSHLNEATIKDYYENNLD